MVKKPKIFFFITFCFFFNFNTSILEVPVPPKNRIVAKRKKGNEEVFCVIGGCGFLGRAIVEELLKRENVKIKIFDLRKTFENNAIQFFTGDIRKLEDLLPAFEGVTTVVIF